MSGRQPIDLVLRRRGREVHRWRAEADIDDAGDLQALLEAAVVEQGDKVPRDLGLYEMEVYEAGSRSMEFPYRSRR